MKRAFALVLLGAGVAHAGGLERPNVVGPRALGIGGGYTAIADDPTAVWHNPAGTAIYGDNVGYAGLELVFPKRTYTPDAQSPLGQAGITRTLTESTPVQYIPDLGLTTRFGFGKNAPTRFAFSLLVYDAFGGSAAFDPASITANGRIQGLQSTTLNNLEIAPALAYQINQAMSIGAALRIGVGSFQINDVESAFSTNLSGSGVGVGATLGMMLRPHRLVQIGAVYRSPLSQTLSGSGPLTVAGTTSNKDFSVNISWPQSAGLGVTVFPLKRLLATVQADWTGWSSVQTLTVDLGGLQQTKQMRFNDTYTLHAGLQGVITRFLVARVGWSLDTPAFTERNERRENQDILKNTIAAGLGLRVWKLFFDAAFEYILPATRVVATPLPANGAPENETGSYAGTIYSAELSAQIRF